MADGAWDAAPVGPVRVVPVLISCVPARARETGVAVGLVLLALLVVRGAAWPGTVRAAG
ncbi:hypothetical protein [Lentzea sp. E54]|uniref:hypothetical protein n=1 Tax=Lentzea xerophila TaxID=3435883 RepID=UPI003DA4F56B